MNSLQKPTNDVSPLAFPVFRGLELIRWCVSRRCLHYPCAGFIECELDDAGRFNEGYPLTAELVRRGQTSRATLKIRDIARIGREGQVSVVKLAFIYYMGMFRQRSSRLPPLSQASACHPICSFPLAGVCCTLRHAALPSCLIRPRLMKVLSVELLRLVVMLVASSAACIGLELGLADWVKSLQDAQNCHLPGA